MGKHADSAKASIQAVDLGCSYSFLRPSSGFLSLFKRLLEGKHIGAEAVNLGVGSSGGESVQLPWLKNWIFLLKRLFFLGEIRFSLRETLFFNQGSCRVSLCGFQFSF